MQDCLWVVLMITVKSAANREIMMLNRNSEIQMRRIGFSQATVSIDGAVLSPNRSLNLRNHSPTGFEWGYGGSGPSQLALALLLEAGLSGDEAQALYMRYKFDVISSLDWEDTLRGADVLDWIEANRT